MLLIAVGVLALALAGLLVYLRQTRAPARAPEPSQAGRPAGEGDSHEGGDGGARLSTAGRPDAAPRASRARPARDAVSVEPAPHEGPREPAIRDKVEGVLKAYPGTASIDSITCTGPVCRVELQIGDLGSYGTIQARLEEPGTGFADDAESMLLEQPVALGTDGAGPWRIAFSLTYPAN